MAVKTSLCGGNLGGENAPADARPARAGVLPTKVALVANSKPLPLPGKKALNVPT